MLKVFVLMLAGAAAFAADDAWQKVKDVKSGTELRVFRKGSSQPLQAQMGELTEGALVVIEKNAERAIPREEIDRIEARPPKSAWVKEEKTKDAVSPDGSNSSSYSSGYSKGPRGDFETIYRRHSPPPKK
ncbi:MAG: hypothetical protein U0Q18_15705 [Bryobacteraceae bacterium]